MIIGSVIVDPLVQDTANAFVYRQSPETKDNQGRQFRIRPGQMMDIWLSKDRPNIDSIQKSTQAPEPEPKPEEDN